MNTQLLTLTRKSLNSPDEIKHLGKGKVEIINLEEGTRIERVTLKPGWRWSHDARPVLGTPSCPSHHTLYLISGRLMILMEDGHQMELQAGDAAIIPSGHDAWVIGDEPCVMIDFMGAKEFVPSERSEYEAQERFTEF
jgi:quercetin dioxygenase-like cupin family protein